MRRAFKTVSYMRGNFVNKEGKLSLEKVKAGRPSYFCMTAVLLSLLYHFASVYDIDAGGQAVERGVEAQAIESVDAAPCSRHVGGGCLNAGADLLREIARLGVGHRHVGLALVVCHGTLEFRAAGEHA